jgi:hypothetical protein
MKINEITEAPIGNLKKSAMKFGAKALGAIGAKDTAANLRGKTNLAATANNLYRQFMTYLGTQNKAARDATTQDVIDFLDDKNVDTSNIDTARPMNKDRMNAIFLDKAKEAMAGKGAKPSADDADTQKVKTVYSQVKGQFDQLSMKEKKRLLAALQKNINTPKKKTGTNVPSFKSRRNNP